MSEYSNDGNSVFWTETKGTFSIHNPKMSNWSCYLFGGTTQNCSFIWRPYEGQVPNWFWRKMQYLAFGNRWVKDK